MPCLCAPDLYKNNTSQTSKLCHKQQACAAEVFALPEGGKVHAKRLELWRQVVAMAALRLLVVLLAEAHIAYQRLAGLEKTEVDYATKGVGRGSINLAALTQLKDAARTNMLQAVECIGEPPAPTSAAF